MAWIAGNRFLSMQEMTNNAQQFVDIMLGNGWTREALSGILGNMQKESTINPGIWQNLDEGNLELGVGLVQWTPATKLINWAGENWADGNVQCVRIEYEVQTGIQWGTNPNATPPEPPFSFAEFKASTLPPSTLARYFLYYYEQPSDLSQAPEREGYADYWYTTLDFGTHGLIPGWKVSKYIQYGAIKKRRKKKNGTQRRRNP